MEELERNDIKSKIGKITSLLFWLIVIIALGVSLYYNNSLQEHIYERDALIEKLTQRDSILNKIMDFEYDSIAGTSSYTYRVRDGKVVKYNTLAKELDESKEDYNEVIQRHSEIIEKNKQNEENYNSLYESMNALYKDHNDLVKKYNELVGDYNKNIKGNNENLRNLNVVRDSLSSFKTIVRLTQSNYGITYNIQRENNTKTISINAEKLDSALVLLPYFRNRLTLDTLKNVWIIDTSKRKN